ncbi:MAG: polysaccharide biosynthesis protein, partial [Planctomycetota bacterium]|nr:polysaccharide biosynthesis protein [Planctomycetota bacterium]
YGNVLASRGSVIPLFHEQIQNGGPITITTSDMTRFLLSLEQAVDTVFAAIKHSKPGEIFVPKVKSARVTDIAASLIGKRDIEIKTIGIRPGEKIHEIMVSEVEAPLTEERNGYYVIQSMLPEIRSEAPIEAAFDKAYSSADYLMSLEELSGVLKGHGLMIDDENSDDEELLR